jgi:hypothetical protein
MLAVYVKDPDAHYDRANAAGAKILFGTYRPAVD